MEGRVTYLMLETNAKTAELYCQTLTKRHSALNIHKVQTVQQAFELLKTITPDRMVLYGEDLNRVDGMKRLRQVAARP